MIILEFVISKELVELDNISVDGSDGNIGTTISFSFKIVKVLTSTFDFVKFIHYDVKKLCHPTRTTCSSNRYYS